MPSLKMGKKLNCKKGETFFKVTGEIVCQSWLEPDQLFSPVEALEALLSSDNCKPICHCKVKCAREGIYFKRASRFGPQPPEKFLPYINVPRYFIFDNDQNVVVLGVSDVQGKFYQLIRMKEKAQINEFCDLLQIAQLHPNYILMGKDHVPVQYISAQSSLAEVTDSKSNSVCEEQLEMQEQRTSNDLENQYVTSEQEQETFITGNADVESAVEELVDQPDDLDDEIVPPEPDTEIEETLIETTASAPSQRDVASAMFQRFGNDPLFQQLSKNISREDLWAVDMKYINHDPEHGVQMVDKGPIYMFVARHAGRDADGNSDLNMDGELTPTTKDSNTADVEFTTMWVKSSG